MASSNRDEISRLELLHAAHPDGLVFPHLADAYRRAGRYAQAESVLNAGLRRHADFSSAHVVLGRLRLDQGKRQEAENAFQRVLQLDPENHVALEFLGHLAAEEGRVREALSYLRRLARLKPSRELSEKIAELEHQAEELQAARPGTPGAAAGAGDNDREIAGAGGLEPTGAGDRAGEVERAGERRPGRTEDAGSGRGAGAAEVGSEEDAPMPPLPEPGEVVTETMAELYTRQGLYQRAEAVYRKLYERDPSNARLRARLEEAEARRRERERPASAPGRDSPSTPAGAETEAAPWTPAEALGLPETESGPVAEAVGAPSIRAYLEGVLEWSPAPPPAAPPPEARPPRPRARRGGPPWRRLDSLEELETDAGAAGEADPQKQSLVALTDILVGLLEYRDPFFRGSSSLTRLLATNVAEEMGLGPSDTVDLALAAVLRDLGRLAMGGRLVEPPKSESPEGRRKIERHVDLALQLMEGIKLPPNVTLAVRHHHERWDGFGYPDGLEGEEIPLVARILAVVDSFAAMVSPRPYRVPRKVPDAAAELQRAAGSQYDPAVVDALLRVVARREQPHLGFVQRHHILLVNPDQPGAVVTAAKLCTAGYLAEVAVDPDTARERMRRVPVAALVVSADTGANEAESFVREMRLDPLFASLPIVVVDAGTVDLRVQLLESGADVCFPPGISYGELQGTLGALVRRTLRTREVRPLDDEEAPWLALQGDIQDFPLAWLLQVMKYDSRTAGVGIRTATDQGAIYIENGDVVHAQIRGASAGEAALKEMLQWDKGRFTVQPDAKTRERSIETSIMHLLLTQAVEQDHAAKGIFGAVSDHG